MVWPGQSLYPGLAPLSGDRSYPSSHTYAGLNSRLFSVSILWCQESSHIICLNQKIAGGNVGFWEKLGSSSKLLYVLKSGAELNPDPGLHAVSTLTHDVLRDAALSVPHTCCSFALECSFHSTVWKSFSPSFCSFFYEFNKYFLKLCVCVSINTHMCSSEDKLTCHVGHRFSACSKQDPCLPLCLAGWAGLQAFGGSLVSVFHFDSGTLELETCVTAPGFTWGVGIGTQILIPGCQVLSSVLACSSVAITNTMARVNPINGEALFDLTTHRPSWRDVREELKTGAWSRELKQRPRRSATHCLVLHCFLACFFYTT